MFLKRAQASIVASIDGSNPTLVKKAQQVQPGLSVYKDGIPQRIDIKSAIKLIADAYDVSKDPNDYIFVVARAVSAELPGKPNPNENGDSFPRDELLRFDHKLARRVYKTFDFKPNHINHRAQNPKTARGFILDSSYNSLNPDDQFVECLIAIDATKDPAYAEGIRSGAVDSFSMGCVAEYTVCSKCGNKATNRWEFCRDIVAHKMKVMDGVLVYEVCGGVCFEELSAVDQPADPKALMQEILAIQARIDRTKELSAESEVLMLKSRLAKLEKQLSKMTKEETMSTDQTKKVAQAAVPPPPSPPPAPVMASDDEDEEEMMPVAQELPEPGETDLSPEAQGTPTADPGMMPFAGGDDLEEYKDKKELEDTAPMSDDEIGVMSAAAKKLPTRFARRYGSLTVLATRGGNFKLHDERTHTDLFAVRPPVKVANRKKAMQFSDVILRYVACYGINKAMQKLRAIPYPKKAQVLDHADDNLQDKPKAQRPSGDDAVDNLEDPLGEGSSDTAVDADTDREEGWDSGPSSAIDDRENNAAGVNKVSPGSISSSDSPDSDKREDPEEYSVGDGDGALDEETHDHSERVGKLIRFYQRKLAAQEKAYSERMASLEARAQKLADQKFRAAMQKFERCLRVASERQRLNREESPLKIAMAEALLCPFDINDQERFAGIDTDLTGQLVERGMQDGMPAHLESLIVRAKDLYKMDDRLLVDSESDLRHAIVAPVASSQSDSRSSRSIEMEERAINGNPVLRTSASYEGGATDKIGRIRASLNILSGAQRAEALKGTIQDKG